MDIKVYSDEFNAVRAPDRTRNRVMTNKRRLSFRKTVDAVAPPAASDYLAFHTGLSKSRVKDAMIKGAAWITKKGAKRRRLRRAAAVLGPGDVLEFYYDDSLLEIKPPAARCLDDQQRYSVWFKPAGVMAQGTDYGDHCSLLRLAEIHFRPQRPVFLVHRLDREVAGLMLIAHDRRAAAQLSALFRDNGIMKQYQVRVRGKIEEQRGEITLPLDGKRALTRYTVTDYDAASDVAALDVTIETGRLHQIRRHFAMIHHPVMGDPKYGIGNKNKKEGMQLAAVGLCFRSPFSGREVNYSIHDIVTEVL